MLIIVVDMDRDFQIETDRLILRAFSQDDLENLVAILGDWEVTRWLSSNIPYPFTKKEGEQFLQEDEDDFRKGDNVRFSVIDKKTKTHIGGVRLFSVTAPECEVGYWLSRDHWKMGYASEILDASIKWLVDVGNVKRLVAQTAAANMGSRKVLEKFGFRHQGTPPAEHARCGHGAQCSEYYVLNISKGIEE